MKKIACLIAIPALALSVGCTNMSTTEQSTLSGAAIGALGGAAIGGLTGGNAGTGALIGGAAGAVVGNIYGRDQEQKQQQRRNRAIAVARYKHTSPRRARKVRPFRHLYLATNTRVPRRDARPAGSRQL
jgi:osmotically inducible lipoprotein OsmB